MKAVMLMFDSLNRHMLPPYGCDWVHAPNFQRLSERTAVFDRCYAGSLPCMPARRDLHTGRYNFLHRSWGPLEPFDDSFVDELRKNGVYTHLTTDHNHYFEDGGSAYHTRYNSWEFARGQEGDPWKGNVKDPNIPETLSGPKLGDLWRQDWVNRSYLDTEEKQPLAVTVRRGLEFIERNWNEDRWFLQIEAFDPHEPFFTLPKYKALYPHMYTGKHFDWPDYAKVKQEPEEVQHLIYEYAALVSMCDAYLGQVLDAFDRYDLWKDTLLIVNTDHGFLLGEHEWWGKNIQPLYSEIANIPLFIWDPRSKAVGRREALVQTIDYAPTLLGYFGVAAPSAMQGRDLAAAVARDAPVREAALFGIYGGHVNCTDGRYVYMRAPSGEDNGPLYEYTLMPAHMHRLFDPAEFHGMELAGPFGFTKGAPVMKIRGRTYLKPNQYGTLLFDLAADPKQAQPLQEAATEARLLQQMVQLMQEHEAPPEQYARLGLAKTLVP
ncbi:sulfatase [Paenibacillus whitsoniae]|uniref:Sulfatase n=1 Tax=Paenibacillus whitsoniae TaxID=2496558 RepID=A0A430J9Z1_9BACL|nr:sulfatase [Paenibacillus whitsoniae]RTE07871.1 sulfatase [Paenibacillus whitsoniae]